MGIIMVLFFCILLYLVQRFNSICLFFRSAQTSNFNCNFVRRERIRGCTNNPLLGGASLQGSLYHKFGCFSPRYYSSLGSNKNLSSNTLDYISYYLAGLLEGDGHFNTPKKLKSPSGTARVAILETVFALKDKPSAELLKSLFGGRVYDHPNKKLTRWLVQDKKSVINIINIINGKLRTPKINSLYDMIDFLNVSGANITKLPLDTSPLNSNAWLSGFIDADGHFAIKGFSLNPKTHLGIHFQLSQRNTDRSGESLEKILLEITEFLLVKLNSRTFSEKYRQFVINTSNRVSNKILIDYLNTYPLLSSKYLDFKDWETANNIYINKLHKDPIQFEKIRELKVNMNNGRTKFSWSHHKHLLPH